MKPNLSWLKKRSKSKTPEPCRSCQNPVVDLVPQPSTLYTYHPQPYHQHQVYQHHPSIQAVPLSTCPYQCQPQHIIQSPQQSITCPIQNQFRNNTLESRPVGNPMVLNSQIQLPPAQIIPMPTYQTVNQVQPQTVSSQSPRCSDNPYYSNQNQMASLILQQQQQLQQHQLQQHQQQLQHQQQQQHQQHLIDERQKQHQQQLLEQQLHQKLQLQQQPQQHHQIQTDERQKQHQQQVLEQQIHQKLQFQQQQQQQESLRQRQYPQQLQQQQYQNHQVVKELANGDCNDLSLEALYSSYSQGKENLLRMATDIKGDLSKLNDELESIKKETPVYSVCEAKI